MEEKNMKPKMMRKISFNRYISIVMAFMLCVSICIAVTDSSADEVEPISITIQFNKSEVNINESIKATYSITGGNGNYSRITYLWQENISGTWVDKGGYVYPSKVKDTISYTPTTGSKVRLWMHAVDSDGRASGLYSEVIPVIGSVEVEPISITIQFNKREVSINESIRATYSVTGGNGNYSRITYLWQENISGIWVDKGGYVYPSKVKDTISYTPTTGSKVRLWMHVVDSDGRASGLFSESVPVNPLTIVLNSTPTTLKVGKSFQLSPYLNYGEETVFIYKSSNSGIATVSKSGVIKGVAKGKADITITGESSKAEKTISISIIDSNTPVLSATMATPRYSIVGTSAGTQQVLSFETSIVSGTEPYSFTYELLRDYSIIFTSQSDSIVFSVSGSSLYDDGIYTARATIEDASGQIIRVSSAGYFRRSNYSSVMVSDYSFKDFAFSVPAGTKQIGDEAFYGINASEIYIPNTCAKIESLSFGFCRNLRMIRIPQQCTSIADDAFKGCSNLIIVGKSNSAAEKFAKEHRDYCSFLSE